MAGLTLGTLGGMGSLITACGGEGSEGPAPEGSEVAGSLTLVYQGTAEELPAYKSLFDSFREEYPDVTLSAQPIQTTNWSEFFDTVATQLAGGKTFDIVYVPTEGQLLFASKDLVEPLDAYIERDRAELQDFYDDVNPRLIEWAETLGSPDGKTYFIPYVFNTNLIWWNTKLFQEAGVEAPADDWTWEEFDSKAQELARRTDAFAMHVTPEYFIGIMPWLLTNGISTMNEDWTEATVATPAATESAEFMRSMVEKGVSPAPGGTFDPYSAAAQGRLAMYGAGRWPIINMRDLNFVDEMRILPFPQNEGKGSPVGWGSLPILRASQNKEAAWAFVKFLTTRKAQEQLAREGLSAVPARKSVATSEVFLRDSPKGTIKLYDALEFSTPVPGPNQGSIVQKDIEDTWTQILAGNVDAEQALEELDARIQETL